MGNTMNALARRPMTANLEPYPAYKPSGVEWLGDLPVHWAVRRLRTVAAIINGATPSTSTPSYWNGEILWFTPEDLGRLTTRYIEGGARQITQEGYNSCGTSLAPAGSLAISTRAPIGHLGILRLAACVNQGCRLLVPNKAIHSTYLYYMLKTARCELETLGQGSTFMELSQGKLAGFTITVPPPSEQNAIARYLDYADRRIRRYISAKQKFISLLDEQRQAIVQRAVTRGLDSNVHMKPSGVEWLGDVPEHWEVATLKRVAELNPSKTEAQSSLAADTPVTFLPMACVGTDGTIDGEVLTASTVWSGFTYFRRNDVLVAKITPCFENGKGACLDSLPTEIGFGSTEFHVLRANSSVSSQFLYHTTNVVDFRRLGANAMTGAAGQQRVPLEFVANHPLAIPPLPEQKAIVAYLGKATADIDTAIARTRRQVDLLHEYRTRLIADVVTGKLDVEKAAAGLPDVDPVPTNETEPSINAVAETGREAIPALQAAAHQGEVPGIQRHEERGVRGGRRTNGRPI